MEDAELARENYQDNLGGLRAGAIIGWALIVWAIGLAVVIGLIANPSGWL